LSKTDSAIERPAPSQRLRVWLVALTILSVLGLLTAIPAAFFGTYMAAFAADDPNATGEDVIGFMVAVWAIAAGYMALIIAGVAGGWIAYRKRHGRLAFGLSLLAALPILLVILAILALVITNFIWTLSI
jgi:hypothetical protein